MVEYTLDADQGDSDTTQNPFKWPERTLDAAT